MININEPAREYAALSSEIEAGVLETLRSGRWLFGKATQDFAQRFSEYVGVEHMIPVANGTDALEIGLRAVGVGPGDEVLTAANAGGYTSIACRIIGAVPVYADIELPGMTIDPDEVSSLLSPKVKAVVVTHLYGNLGSVEGVRRALAAAGREDVAVVEDCAQAHGVGDPGRRGGSLGDLATFSFCEPAWDSPWGPGRPGWHIECSAMSTCALGNHFDIHGGGADLQFPHHENEIAQSEGATGEPFVNVWMHNGFVRVNDEKMSKSLGNFFTVREILTRFRPEEVRYFILTSQYRSPLNYDDEQLEQARAALSRLYTALRGLPAAADTPAVTADATPFITRFHAAMDDDFNTPEALAVLFELAREINRARADDPAAATALASELRRLGAILGLLQADPEVWLKGQAVEAGLSDQAIETLIQTRIAARAARDWSEADRIRDQLAEAGILLEDGPKGTTWRRAS